MAKRQAGRAEKTVVVFDLPVKTFASQRAWEAWLDKHHETSRGLWLKFAKKASGVASVYYPEALEVALCYGWIDGLVRTLDDRFYVQRFTPRRPRSKWSRINCGKATNLIAAGKMKPAGLRQVETAKADGRWEAAYASPRVAEPPDGFLRELTKRPKAKAFFETLSGRNRFAILFRIQDAKKPETRARRIAQYAAMLEAGNKPY